MEEKFCSLGTMCVIVENKKRKCYNQTAGKEDMEYGENIF